MEKVADTWWQSNKFSWKLVIKSHLNRKIIYYSHVKLAENSLVIE